MRQVTFCGRQPHRGRRMQATIIGSRMLSCYCWHSNGLSQARAIMMNMPGMTKQRMIHLASELVIIVIGVLIALAFDEWRGNLDLEERKRHVLTSLLIDLKEDRHDINDFINTARKRASLFLSMAATFFANAACDARPTRRAALRIDIPDAESAF